MSKHKPGRFWEFAVFALPLITFVACSTHHQLQPGVFINDITSVLDGRSRVHVDSIPSGADIYASDDAGNLGERLGITPLEFEYSYNYINFGALKVFSPASCIRPQYVSSKRFNLVLGIMARKDGYKTTILRKVIEVFDFTAASAHTPSLSATATATVVLAAHERGLAQVSRSLLPPSPSPVPARVPAPATTPTPISVGHQTCDVAQLPRLPVMPSLAVLDFSVVDEMPAHDGEVLADLCRKTVLESNRFLLVDREAMKALLAEEDLAKSIQCDDTRCLVNYGRKLRAQKIIYGKVNRLGQSLALTVKVVDVGSSQVEAIETERASGTVEVLADLMDVMTCRLLKEVLERGGGE